MADINISRLKKFNTNKFMFHVSDEKLTLGHIDFWIEEFLKSEIPFSILVRTEKSYKEAVKKYTNMQICYAKNPVDVETVVNAQPDLKMVLYSLNSSKNIHLLRFNHLTHIFIGSKNSEWLSQFNKSYRAYDEIWCGGEFVKDRIKEEIQNTGHLQFKIVGKPQLKDIFLSSEHSIKDGAFIYVDNDQLLIEKIYYANVVNNNNMFFLLNDKNIKNDLKKAAKNNMLDKKIKIFEDKDLMGDFINKSDCIITDIKKLTPYLLAYDLPIIVYLEKEIDKYKIEPEILRNIIYYFNTKEELNEILQKLKVNDVLKQERKKITNYFFNIEATKTNKFINLLKGGN